MDVNLPVRGSVARTSTIHRLRIWVLVALACGALCATAWAALAPIHSDSREQVYAIPKGTWARRQAGEKLDIIPAEIHLTIGAKDVLIMINDDDVPQLFGPVLIMPGQSFKLPFRRASTYLFACPLHTSGLLTIIVDAMPDAGWQRLRWRAIGMVRAAALL